ncbi:GxxExxY protein [Roseibacillus ishigakijimensis]|uniref:GxxExxY protein n=1 Tax=Roseibacillus ishigakijimensis TaxID=454146 RepID=A0A934RL10_9BACT|nr:GxxExxY protein [Roseibacillus ishigakijimensis]MBK1833662.1 GxxExxY protein [Roseibacillus ishigakijimensis]
MYENGLAHRLTKQGYAVTQQSQLQVFDEDHFLLGTLEMDLVVENEIIIELKAVKNLTNEHVAQLLGYLRATRKEHGLLINFGNPKLQIKKYILSKDL